eukprot:scaffold97428_cov17-Tisochrysis_lutea.AAC.1
MDAWLHVAMEVLAAVVLWLHVIMGVGFMDLSLDGFMPACGPSACTGLPEEQDVLPQRMMSLLRPGSSNPPLRSRSSCGSGGAGAASQHTSAPSQQCQQQQQQQQQQQCCAAAEAVPESPSVRATSSAPQVELLGTQGGGGGRGAPSRSLEDTVKGLLAAPDHRAGGGDRVAAA